MPAPALDLKDFVRDSMTKLQGVVTTDHVLEVEKENGELISAMRRRARRRADDPISTFSLVDEGDGVVRFAPGAVMPYAQGRRGSRSTAPSGKVLEQFKFEDLPPNKMQGFLNSTDETIRGMNPGQEYGLREWKYGQGHIPVNQVADDGRILLIVHGFISSTNHLIEEMGKAPDKGDAFLKQLPKTYKQILTFDHPTVAISPVLNAMDLHRQLGPTNAAVDVICHSRGGLVTRWWLEGLGGPRNQARRPRVIFLGSPLAGTSLASPARLRAVMDLLATLGSYFGTALDYAGAAVPFAAPFLVVAGAIFKIVSSITKAIAKTPIIDAGINMVAGVSGMSRVGNNPELARLRDFPRMPAPDYFAVRSNFHPKSEGWRFWRYFYNIGDRVKNLFMDQIFEKPNDLIVDVDSMTQIGPRPGDDIPDAPALKRICDFGTSDTVHHNNYFRQKKTIEFFEDTLFKRP
ncbi:MAG: hypothetical protein HYX68_29150 [Planctomycetes bacterium]|nr:hypothetical protein [Planctomycetota bacterium]